MVPLVETDYSVFKLKILKFYQFVLLHFKKVVKCKNDILGIFPMRVCIFYIIWQSFVGLLK